MMETMRRLVHFVLFLAGCTTILSSNAEQRPIAQGTDLLSSQEHDANTDLATYVDGARKQFNVPGIAIVVVKDGRVVFEQGSGERKLNDGKPVDVHTMFCIASNTKSFTATAIEILADQGKLKLEDRVVDHLPWFRMADPYATREMRIRDILAHRSGLGSHAGDLLFVPASTYSTREVVERLRDLPLATGFRSSFDYENIMYAVATLIIEQVSGESYADFIREHIFVPIGMTESRIDSTYLTPSDDVAKWVEVQLASGRLPEDRNGDTHRLFSAASQQRMWSTITPIDIEPASVPQLQAAQPNFLGYAEGWYLSDYRGQRTVWHGGGFPGTVSLVTLVPSLHLGIVVLTNQQSEEVLNAITFHILDTYMGARETNWIEAYAASAKLDAARKAEESAKRAAERLSDARPSHALASYAGTYRDRWYGDIVVWLDGGELRLRFRKPPRLVGSLSPWRKDTFLVRWDDRTLDADALIDFTADRRGWISGAGMRRASPRTAHAYDYQDLHLVLERPGTAN